MQKFENVVAFGVRYDILVRVRYHINTAYKRCLAAITYSHFLSRRNVLLISCRSCFIW